MRSLLWRAALLVCWLGVTISAGTLTACSHDALDTTKPPRVAAPSLPSYPNAERIEPASTSGSQTGSSHTTTVVYTTDTVDMVVAFYRDALVPSGWTAVGTRSLVDRQACPIYTLWFTQQPGAVELRLTPEPCMK